MAARKDSSFDTKTASHAVVSEHSARFHNIELQHPAQSAVALIRLALSLALCGPSSSQRKHSNTRNKNSGGKARYEVLAKQFHNVIPAIKHPYNG